MSNFNSSVIAFFGGDTSGLEKAVLRAETTVSAFQSAMGKIGITIGAAAVIGFFKSVTDKASQINDLSDSLGASTDAIQSFAYAVRLAGGRTEDAARAMQVVRNKVDELAEGNEKTAQTFAKLGLAQEDLIGIPLEQALEKIARGYVNNQDKAGAYAALVDIVGNKSAKLTGVLEQLGRDGFGAMEAGARSAGQVIEESTIKKLDDLGDRAETLKGRLVNAGASFMDFVMKGVDGLGVMAAVVVNTWDGIVTAGGALEETAQKAVAGVTTATAAIKGQMGTAKDFAAFNEAEAKREIERMELKGNHQAKLNGMLELAKRYINEAATYQENSKEQLELIGKANAVILEYDKEIAKKEKDTADKRKEAAEDHIKAMDKLGELQFDRLTKEEKIVKLQKEAAEIRGNIEVMKAKGVDTTLAQVALLETENKLTKELAQGQAKVTEELKKQEGILAGIRGSKQLGGERTEVLQEIMRRNSSEIDRLTRIDAISPASQRYNQGEIARLTLENQNLQREVALRRDIASTVAKEGYGAGLQKFPGAPESFDRFLSVAQGQDQKFNELNTEVKAIGTVLRSVFRK